MFKTTILEPGQRLGKYHVISELGRGGMGCVYLAEDESLSRRVAIKVIMHHEGADDSFVEKLAHEAKVIANLSHPNVVHVHAFDVIAGIPIIEMEYIEGGSLANRLQQEFVLPAEAVRYAHNVSRALAYSHSMGAIHRDVKPSNILIDHHEQARLADFGIAKALAESEMIALTNSRSGVFHGTPYYAPPEAWEGQEATESWDIYSLGAVMFEAVTGAPPHEAKSPLELARKMATEDVQPVRELNPKISVELGRLVDDLLQRNTADRPADAVEVASRIEGLPEFGAESDRGSSTVRMKIPKTLRTRTVQGTQRDQKRKNLGLGVFVASVILVLLWLGVQSRGDWLRGLDNAAASLPGSSTLTPMQDLSILTAEDHLATVLDTSKIDGNNLVFSARFPGIGPDAVEHWLVSMSEANAPQSILGYGDSRIIRLNLDHSADDYRVSGNWAGYEDIDGTVFRRGVVRGQLHWDEGAKGLLGTLTFIGDHDGSTRDTTVSAHVLNEMATDSRFIFNFEESDLLPALVQNELRPRNESLADLFDNLSPVFVGGSATVRMPNPNSEAISNRELTYSELTRIASQGAALPDDLLVGIPVQLRPFAQFSLQQENIEAYFACRVLDESHGLRLEIQLAKTLLVPVSETPVLRLVHHTQGNVSFEYYGLEDHDPNTAKCTVQSVRNEEKVIFFVSIPHDAFRLDPNSPSEGERLRFAAAIYSDEESEQSRRIAQWGFPNASVAKHGAVLRFGH